MCAFLNQVPTLVAVFLTQYFYASCEEDLTLLEAERRYPLMYYFYSMYLLLVAGVTSRIRSRVLTLLAIISTCSVALLGQISAAADAALLARREGLGCQGGYHIFAAIVYLLVLLLSFGVVGLLWAAHKMSD